MTQTMTATEITAALRQATGTVNYYEHRNHYGNLNGLYTDGIKLMADMCGAYWLIDAIMSYQRGLRHEEFQLWTLQKHTYKSGPRKGDDYWILTGEDGNERRLARQVIRFSDFPLDEIRFYFTGPERVLLLPSEY